ncbi:MAG: RNA 3'-terminal phosphate cyclase [Candidatus Hadarchaeales archaeon]
MIEIDGSMGEGGGSVVRVAVTLSAVSQQPVRIFNIRARRSRPGLHPQHLKAIEAVARLCNAKVEGLTIGSKEITFIPGTIGGGKYRVDIGTAGGTTLILQAIMPAAAFSSSRVELEITGGTDNPQAPPIDFMKNVTLPNLRRMGFNGDVVCIRRGHYPKGGGIIQAKIDPVKNLSSIKLLDAGNVVRIRGIAHAMMLPAHIARRMAHAATKALLAAGYSDVEIKTEVSEEGGLGPGTGITLWAETDGGAILGGSSLGRPGKMAEHVGREAVEALLKEIEGGAVDSHTADQLIPYLALANGISEIKTSKLTLHALTNIALVEKILGVKFSIEGDLGIPSVIRVEGIGKENPAIGGNSAKGIAPLPE